MAAEDLFNVPVFFILFRETTEIAIIVSVLLSFLKKTFDNDSLVYKKLRKQVWVGSLVGFVICLCIGAAFIAVWYTVLSNLWGNAELIWEGVFSLIATIMITIMGLAMLRVEKMQEKWKLKLAKAMEADSKKKEEQQQDVSDEDIIHKTEEEITSKNKNKKSGFKLWLQRYAFFMLPFITVLREGLEAVVFIGGVSLNAQAKSFPIAVIMGIICGALIGFIIYRGGSMLHLRWFFIFSTIILYLVAAGLMSKAVGFFEQYSWNLVIGGEVAEEGGDVIPYKVTTSVFHVNWGNPEIYSGSTGGYQIFNSILGWNNTWTIGTIVSYCLYWLLISIYLLYQLYKQRRNAIEKAKRGEYFVPDADEALEKAKEYVKKDAIVAEHDDNNNTNTSTDSSDIEAQTKHVEK